MSKSNQPQDKWGFYAQVPRIVRTKYKQLSHAEKWLYTCLKDLCGDKGQCFRSLRSLSQETDISTGSLSKMVPHLHESGLIHAEKKKRTESGKEIWHITITDIWKANAAYCSNSEQSKHEKENVQKMNVQNLNDDCSKNEPGCSNFVDRRIQGKNTNSEEERERKTSQEKPRTSEQPASSSHTLESTSSHSQNDTQEPPSEGEKTTQAPLLARPEKPEMPPDVMRWSAEKLVQVTEARLGKYYSDQSRPDQLKAAQKILQKKVTEEQYIAAYDDRNDDWWHQKKGLLHVVHMAARTDRGQMRIVEILDKLDDTPALKQATQTAAVLAEAGVKSGMRLENGKLVIDSNKTVSGLSYFNIPQRGA